MLAEAVGFGGAAASAGDDIPVAGQSLAGLAGARVTVDHRAAGQRSEVDDAPVGRRAREGRDGKADELGVGSVVLGGGQIGG
jgi:hypothetical protein